ncbi:MAG: PrsW family intramembrane metalloprotease [Eggerthellaceae bacterium]|nr:PrsW family intramembrane metalloprotease [Eggerthellaceae bacterium]
MELLLLAAVLPAIALMVYVYKKDKVEKEPLGLIIRMFVLGMVAGPLAGILETVLFAAFESTIEPGVLLLVLEFFVGVAAVEEGFKYLFLSTVRKNPNFNYVFDGIVYAVAVALGFAALENILYVFDGGFEVAVMRAIFSVPGHCADGVVMGCFFGLARHAELSGRKSNATLFYVLAFVLPTIEHGIYDSALSTESDILALFAMAFQLVFILFAGYLVKKVSKEDKPIGVNAVNSATAEGQLNAPRPAQPIPPQQATPTQFQQPTMSDWEQANQPTSSYPPHQND